jgi:transketolase
MDAPTPLSDRLALIADMCRANTLVAVKKAGSGHLGSSFSAMEIVVGLYYRWLNTLRVGLDSPDRDIYFSSKGHDVPGLYAVLFSIGVISRDQFLKLRRLGGLDGHPDIGIPGIEANSGSLGMGISKGKGMALAKRLGGYGGHVFVLTGDGEWQEGQNYEALQSAAQQKVGHLNVIMDHNKVQTDKPVTQIIDLGELEKKIEIFGWHTARCDGHDFSGIERILAEFRKIEDRPKILIADTIKGRGVSFMEHPRALENHQGLYPWHAGAPADAAFEAAHAELIERINGLLTDARLGPLMLEDVEPETGRAPMSGSSLDRPGQPTSRVAQSESQSAVSDEYVARAFGDALVEIAGQRKDIVVLDADLASDCRIRDFELKYPQRFFENGIAEQDMVSTAGGLARLGFLPVVNSFASFLASRSNEQIYNNASERTKIIYACHYAGLIPAGPGKSHQSLRDISLFGALPNCLILQPGNAAETRMAVEYCVLQAPENCMIRLAIGPSPRKIALPADYRWSVGKGAALEEGRDAVLFAYGPVMLNEALLAGEILNQRGFGLTVINMPWLNRVDKDWLVSVCAPYHSIFVLDDHAPVGGLGDRLLSALSDLRLLTERRLFRFAVEGFPACGTPAEALAYHGLDGASLSRRILSHSE